MPLPCTEAQTGSPQLALRFTHADDGRRPVPRCVGWWRSPDLWLDQGDVTVAHLRGSTAPGVVNRVMARVTNLSDATTYRDINVEVWICPFGTDEAGPHTQVASAGAFPRTGFHPGPLAPGQSVVIACAPPWRPDADDRSISLVANCWADDPPDGRPLAGDLDFCCDAHQARRSAAVTTFEIGVPVPPPGGGSGGFGGHFAMIANPDPNRARTLTFQVVPADPRAFGPGDAAFLRSLIDEAVEFVPSLPPAGVSFGAAGAESGGDPVTVVLGPGGQEQLFAGGGYEDVHQLSVGQVFAYDLIQRNEDGAVVGGLVYYLAVIRGPVEEGVVDPNPDGPPADAPAATPPDAREGA